MIFFAIANQILICAMSNFVRGRGIIRAGHTVARLIMSLCWAVSAGLTAGVAGASLFDQMVLSLIVFAGTLFWPVFGWGLYFSSFNGYWKKGESEIRWIDWIGYKLVPFVSEVHTPTNLRRGTICMALRGLYIFPLFVALAAYTGQWWIASFGFGGLMQGPAYGVMRHLKDFSQGVYYAEPLTGGWFGLLIGISIMLLW